MSAHQSGAILCRHLGNTGIETSPSIINDVRSCHNRCSGHLSSPGVDTDDKIGMAAPNSRDQAGYTSNLFLRRYNWPRGSFYASDVNNLCTIFRRSINSGDSIFQWIG